MHYFIIKLPNKRELQQIAFNHLSDIAFQVFVNLYKKCIAKSYSFLFVDAALASDNPLCFRKNLVERIWKLIIAIDEKMRDEKLQYYFNREPAKISALSSGKIDKYGYRTGKEILPFIQRQVIEQVKFAYSPLEKAFEKQKRLKIKEKTK